MTTHTNELLCALCNDQIPNDDTVTSHADAKLSFNIYYGIIQSEKMFHLVMMKQPQRYIVDIVTESQMHRFSYIYLYINYQLNS